MGKSLNLKIVMALALAQAIAGLLRALNWVEIGVDLFGQGLLLLPFIGLIAVMRGLLIALVALLYGLFVIGTLLRCGWARWIGLTAAIINLILVLSVSNQGAPVEQVIAWSAVPLILMVFLFSPTGRTALKGVD